MFHLLTAITDVDAFAMRRRSSPDAARDGMLPTGAVLPAVRRVPMTSDSPLSPVHATGPTHATSWHRPLLCCGLSVMAYLVGSVRPERAHAQTATPPSRAEKIANALTAAPEEIARNATVKDWPSREGEGLTLLRQGTNGWVCLPDDQVTHGNDPMCMDEAFHDAVAAYLTGKAPKVTRVAYAYMLTSDAEGSNTDPRATHATPTNQWHHAGPHVMVLFPDAKLLDGLPTKPSAYGPYVMFPGTPVAHVMLPVQSGFARSGSHSASSATSGKRP